MSAVVAGIVFALYLAFLAGVAYVEHRRGR